MGESRQLFGYSLFDDVEDKNLQAYNRAVVMRNLSADRGDDAVKEYFEMIPHQEQLYAIGKLGQLADIQRTK
jgi:hypothetical protein